MSGSWSSCAIISHRKTAQRSPQQHQKSLETTFTDNLKKNFENFPNYISNFPQLKRSLKANQFHKFHRKSSETSENLICPS